MTRVLVAGRVVVRKELLGPDAQRRVQHELAMLGRLRGVAGVAQLVDAPGLPGSVVMQDVDGRCLAELAKPLAVDELIELAVGLARAVAGMHRRGVMHRHITPANVVVSGDGVPYLVDFALASPFAGVRPEFTHYTDILGTLAYLAPEQTGRTARSVDQRADLYGLGATLYELATGGPPFGFGDPLQLTHAHLAHVPVPPVKINPDVPELFSEVVMHLLEKEPDNRYQTAEGVLHDLERLRDTAPGAEVSRVGERDVPLRLSPPSRLVGRDAEVAALETAFTESLSGGCRGVLVGGVPGVGKTALVDELRPVVTGGGGWFVSGKFDQYRRDLEFDAVHQVLRGLARLLLAEPEDELTRVRERILAAVGPNVGLLTAVQPELAALLEVRSADPGDPLTAQVRSQRIAVEVLRAVASRKRPLVVFVDDLQWAGRTPLGVVDLLLSEEQIDGLLLVSAYREGDVDPPHPLSGPLSRWREHPQVRHLRLANLPVSDSVALVAEMLHVDRASAAGLVELISPYLSGNPYETVELLNALRRDGVVTATAAGWRWDAASLRAYVGGSDVAALLATGVAALSGGSRRLVEAMACLGGSVELSVLQAAIGKSATQLERCLAPALDEGLVVMEPGVRDAVRFRHDRIREMTLRGLDPRRRRALQLAMARRLAGVPELFAVAAEQYLPVVDAVEDGMERRRVVGLLRRAADQAVLVGNYMSVNALLTAALRLVGPADTATLVEVRTGRHAALYSMGRLEDADDEYRTIEGLCTNALNCADATVVQTHSLTHRSRFAEAIELCLGALRELGIAVPAADRLPTEADHRFDYLYQWVDQTRPADDLAQPEITEPVLLAAARLINAVLPAAFFTPDQPLVAWLSLEALRIWMEHGTAGALLGPMSHTAFAVVDMRGDYASGYRALRRIVALGEARGYEPDTSQARFLSALLNSWFEPFENVVGSGRRAREGLLAGGDLANAGHTYYATVPALLECAPSLDVYVTEVEAGLAFMRRTGAEQTGELLDNYRRVAGVLRGESSAVAGAALPADSDASSMLTLLHAHATGGIVTAVLGDLAGLTRHTAAAMSMLVAGQGVYPAAVARVLRGLALAGQARAGRGGERAGLLSELDDVMRWLAARAADAPANFRHLLRFLEAERAWAVGDFRAAILAFDAAWRDAAQVQRPWHRALITEHAGRFHLVHGLEHTGYTLLAEARQEYLAWGATAKVSQLDRAYPALRHQAGTVTPDSQPEDRPDDHSPGRSTVTTGTIDLLGILSASQALSSETNIAGLHTRLADVLSAMTGATSVQLLVWSADRQTWLLPTPDHGVVPVDGTGREHTVPLSILRYTQRTGEPLVIGDATTDDRFARDPYFTDLTRCSLLAIPVLSRSTLKAVLLLENRLIRGAFTAERLDSVKLIAGQLAVSLDNAHLYAEFRRVADEQTALRRIATLVARSAKPELVFDAVADVAGTLFGADATVIARFEPDADATVMGSYGLRHPQPGWRGKPPPGRALALVQATGRAARTDADDHIAADPKAFTLGLRSTVASPIIVEDRVWGAMVIGSGCEHLPDDTERRLADFTELVATAVANAESRTELTTSRARVVAAADQTRRRIERDVHDGAQQRLVALALQLRMAQAELPPELDSFRTHLDRAVAGATAAVDELREISRGIHPAILTEGGLKPALRALARRSPIPVDLDIDITTRLPERVEISAYYIVAEALTNIAKHAKARTASVTVHADTTVLHVTVHDDGVGGADFTRGTGLLGLKDRAAALGGRITLHSPRGAGTDLDVELPLTATDDTPTQDHLAERG
ncbi:AAA family ATPase [Dactylosporangium aurantiacum]|uniref:AAA family ATPase n=1 Tax=Dactylosporangium aurantiacum TaxID=35754 RepID=A0A9Q9IAT2_9ACTN|nr:AAA family ATPase [Dactylosporangium aurantiacum]MDG6106736.1 AAA family ATPase [Dactylosporangium aurantiacum]UWZ50883.1 AAA family ATPase [Dactylosporangium aurantiacum]